MPSGYKNKPSLELSMQFLITTDLEQQSFDDDKSSCGVCLFGTYFINQKQLIVFGASITNLPENRKVKSFSKVCLERIKYFGQSRRRRSRKIGQKLERTIRIKTQFPLNVFV